MRLCLLLAVASGVLREALACWCSPKHPQQAYCNKDFVLRAKVIGDRWNSRYQGHHRSDPRYDIIVSTIWKGHAAVQRIFNASATASIAGTTGRKRNRSARWLSHIYTSRGSCAVHLEVGMKYVLTGSVLGERLYVTTCDWKTISNKFSRGVRKLFKNGLDCSCDVQPCFNTEPCNHGLRTTACLLDLYKTPQCQYRICRNTHGYCDWSDRIEIDICDNLDNS